jgi:hypothetical protein
LDKYQLLKGTLPAFGHVLGFLSFAFNVRISASAIAPLCQTRILHFVLQTSDALGFEK